MDVEMGFVWNYIFRTEKKYLPRNNVFGHKTGRNGPFIPSLSLQSFRLFLFSHRCHLAESLNRCTFKPSQRAIIIKMWWDAALFGPAWPIEIMLSEHKSNDKMHGLYKCAKNSIYILIVSLSPIRKRAYLWVGFFIQATRASEIRSINWSGN